MTFIAALFTIAKTWKQPKCPSMDEWIKKMWYIYTMKYYSALKKDEIWGRPRGLGVKCAHSAAGRRSSDPGRAPTHCLSSHAEAASHIQQLAGCATMTYNYLLGALGGRKGGGLAIDVSSEPVFLSKKRRIGMDISSGLILTTTTKKYQSLNTPCGEIIGFSL